MSDKDEPRPIGTRGSAAPRTVSPAGDQGVGERDIERASAEETAPGVDVGDVSVPQPPEPQQEAGGKLLDFDAALRRRRDR